MSGIKIGDRVLVPNGYYWNGVARPWLRGTVEKVLSFGVEGEDLSGALVKVDDRNEWVQSPVRALQREN